MVIMVYLQLRYPVISEIQIKKLWKLHEQDFRWNEILKVLKKSILFVLQMLEFICLADKICREELK